MGKLRRPVVTPDSCLTATRPSSPSPPVGSNMSQPEEIPQLDSCCGISAEACTCVHLSLVSNRCGTILCFVSGLHINPVQNIVHYRKWYTITIRSFNDKNNLISLSKSRFGLKINALYYHHCLHSSDSTTQRQSWQCTGLPYMP